MANMLAKPCAWQGDVQAVVHPRHKTVVLGDGWKYTKCQKQGRIDAIVQSTAGSTDALKRNPCIVLATAIFIDQQTCSNHTDLSVKPFPSRTCASRSWNVLEQLHQHVPSHMF